MKKRILLAIFAIALIEMICGCHKTTDVNPICNTDTITVVQDSTYTADQSGRVDVSLNGSSVIDFYVNDVLVYNDMKPYNYCKVNVVKGDRFRFETNAQEGFYVGYYYKECK